MLTEQEVNKIFAWLPYRDNWLVDRNQVDDNVQAYYGNLISELRNNSVFETYYFEDGGLSNFLGFVCYPNGYKVYDGNAIAVYVSLCAPIAAYGQVKYTMTTDFWCYEFIEPEMVGVINDKLLASIENEVVQIINKYDLILLEKQFVCRQLPAEIVEDPNYENHNRGNQYLHGLFQVID